MMRFLVLLLIIAPVTLAHVINQSHMHWMHSGLDTNDVPTQLTQFTIYCDRDDGTDSVTYHVLDPAARSATIAEMALPDGEWTCTSTASNAYGESERSSPVSFLLVNGVKVNPAVPAAPYNFIMETS